MIRVFAFQSQPVVVEGLRTALAGCAEFDFLGAAPGAAETLEAVAAEHPDIVLIDRDDSAMAGEELAAQIVALSRETRPVLWTRSPEEVDVPRAFESGAHGVAPKCRPVEELLECLRAVAAGQRWSSGAEPAEGIEMRARRAAPRLTARERQILELVAQGLKNQQIAEALSIAPGTVKVHLMHVFEKTGARDRFELALRSRKLLNGDAA